jgi:hypothetical protein
LARTGIDFCGVLDFGKTIEQAKEHRFRRCSPLNAESIPVERGKQAECVPFFMLSTSR